VKGKIVEEFYKIIDNIDEKVKEANMPYMQWKVLFLVGEHSNAEEISSFLEEDLTTVQEILNSLESKALIEKVEETKEADVEEKEAEEEPSLSIGDELLVDEEEVISQVDEQIEETATETEEEESSEPEIVISEEKEVIPESEDEFDLSIDEPETASSEEPEPEVLEEESVEEEVPESSDEEIISDSTKKTVMVIDDSIVIRKMIEIALEEEDFNIVTAVSGKEGLELVGKEKPNLVILDMMLPDMSGIEVLKSLKTDKSLPVIMLSGKDSPQLIETAKEVGVNDFLPKPFRDEELVEKVKTLIEA
jgi:CheY-like chemotaxis protein/predicted transcriptional regulator